VIKRLIKEIPLVGPWLFHAKQRYHQWKTDPARLVAKIFRHRKRVSIVQFGSNDDKTSDPIYALLSEHSDWTALLIEPVPFPFSRRKENDGIRGRFKFENVAISEETANRQCDDVSEDARRSIPD
jgi:hypothetical protein